MCNIIAECIIVVIGGDVIENAFARVCVSRYVTGRALLMRMRTIIA